MAAGAFTFTNTMRTDLSNGVYLDADSYKMALFLSTSNIGAASTTYAGLTNEHAGNSGYTTGGIAVTMARTGTTSVKFTSGSLVWTAAGGSIVARFGVVYEVAGNVVGYFLLDSTPANVTAISGETLTVAPNASGYFTLA